MQYTCLLIHIGIVPGSNSDHSPSDSYLVFSFINAHYLSYNLGRIACSALVVIKPCNLLCTSFFKIPKSEIRYT